MTFLIPPPSASPQHSQNLSKEAMKAKFEELKAQIPKSFPQEEMHKLSVWIDLYDPSSERGNDTTLIKITAQLQYIQSLLKKMNTEKEIRRIKGELERANKQIKKIKTTNQEVRKEIERMERQ